MKVMSLVVLLSLTSTQIVHAQDEEGTLSALSYTAGYAGTVSKDKAGGFFNSIGNLFRDTKEYLAKKADAASEYAAEVADGTQKRLAIASGDGVELNAKVYSLALRTATEENEALNQLQADRAKRKKGLDSATKEAKRMEGLAKDYKEDAENFQKSVSADLVKIAVQAQKMKDIDEADKKELEKFVDDHKKLGELTAKDGDARVGSQMVVSLKKSMTSLKNLIAKSPESAKAAGLDIRFKSMSSLFEGATERMTDRENEMMKSIALINEYSKVDESAVANQEEMLKRKMILGTLNNSVNNLINSAEFSKVRAQLAFSHFKDIENMMKTKGVKEGDVKKAYADNAEALASQYNQTPFGMYVNGQIAKAMGTVCDLVANQCKDGSNAELFKFLDDTKRRTLDLKMPNPIIDISNGKSIEK